jgi:hypothetical protein
MDWQASMTPPEPQLLAMLRGERVAPGAWSTPAAAERFLRAAHFHGLMPLLDARLRDGAQIACPPEIAESCRRETLRQAAYELAHRAELARVLAALDKAGVRPLLLKGTALAYSLYPSPVLRPRADTDLLIPLASRERVGTILGRLGYVRRHGIQGEFVSYQATWARNDRSGAMHCLDVHWRINNAQLLASLLNYDELAARAVAVPGLGPQAYGLAPMHALLFACIHRAGHAHAPMYVDGVAHPAMDRIIWLYDIHLLAGAMSAGELAAFAALARSKRVATLCREALDLCRARFATQLPAAVLASLAAPGRAEPSARHFSRGPLLRFIGELRALRTWRDRGRWLRETALPGEAYMRRKYPDAANRWLPLLYARRAIAGAWKWCLPRDARD